MTDKFINYDTNISLVSSVFLQFTMSKKTPRKRKINAVTDEELMPPPQMPVSKKHKSSKQTSTHNVSIISGGISDISNISNNGSTQTKCGPLSIIFEKAQENETLHNKYFKELTNIYENKVSYDWHNICQY